MKKQYTYILLGLLVLGILFIQRCQYNTLKDQLQVKNVELASANDSVTTYRTKHGELVAKVQAVEVERDNARKGLEAAGFEIKELKAADVNWRKVTFALNAKITALGKGTVILHDSITPGRVDTVPVKVGKWNDRYLTLFPALTGNKLNFTYQYQTGLRFFVEKAGKSQIVTVKLTDPMNPKVSNPFAQVSTANSITITPTKHWWDKWYIYTAVGFVGGYFTFK